MAVSKPYTTAYQMAKAKARRLNWTPAAHSGHVDVRKALLPANIIHPKPDDQGQAANSTQQANKAQTDLHKGYDFHQTSKRKSPAGFTLRFKFYSSKSRSQFVVSAFYHEKVEVFMIKFFNKTNKSLNKYAIRTGKGDFLKVLHTNFDILVHLSRLYPKASFGFMGERSFFKDKASRQTLLEPMAGNQRFRIYRLFLQQPPRLQWLRPGFEISYLEPLSTSLMINKKEADDKNIKRKEKEILDYFGDTYPEINFTDL